MRKIQYFCDKCGDELNLDLIRKFNKQELCQNCFPKIEIYDAICCHNCYFCKGNTCEKHNLFIDSYKYCKDFERDHSF